MNLQFQFKVLYSNLHFRCYSSDTDIRFMLLENLQEKDYCCVDKRYGLDFDHLKLVLTSLAKWHATNAVLVIEVSRCRNEVG